MFTSDVGFSGLDTAKGWRTSYEGKFKSIKELVPRTCWSTSCAASIVPSHCERFEQGLGFDVRMVE